MAGLTLEFKQKFIIITEDETGTEIITDEQGKAIGIVTSWLQGGGMPGRRPSMSTLHVGVNGNTIVLSDNHGGRTQTIDLAKAISKLRSYIYGGEPLK